MTKHDVESGQLTISHELLLLLRWLVTHDEEKLKKIINKALSNGLQRELQHVDSIKADAETEQEMHYSVTDFFALMEILLAEGMNQQLTNEAKQQNLMTTLEHIDSTICDDETVRMSLEKATVKIADNPHDNPKDVLYTEILKRWKPHNKNSLN